MIVVLVVLVGIGLWALMIYNGLVSSRNEVQNAWSQIDVQLKRRHDLVPNLVETVKGYAGHEAGTLEAVTKARGVAVGARGVAQSGQAENALSSALTSLLAVAERYPDLKANQNFLALQEELSSTENRIGFARQAYNDAATRYNTRREVFPNSLLAGAFTRADPFQIAEAGDRDVPKVQF